METLYEEMTMEEQKRWYENFEEQKSFIDEKYGTKFVKRILVLMEYIDFREILGIEDKIPSNASKQKCEYGWKYEYVEQYTGHKCDDYHGRIYFPLPDEKYIVVSYQF